MPDDIEKGDILEVQVKNDRSTINSDTTDVIVTDSSRDIGRYDGESIEAVYESSGEPADLEATAMFKERDIVEKKGEYNGELPETANFDGGTEFLSDSSEVGKKDLEGNVEKEDVLDELPESGTFIKKYIEQKVNGSKYKNGPYLYHVKSTGADSGNWTYLGKFSGDVSQLEEAQNVEDMEDEDVKRMKENLDGLDTVENIKNSDYMQGLREVRKDNQREIENIRYETDYIELRVSTDDGVETRDFDVMVVETVDSEGREQEIAVIAENNDYEYRAQDYEIGDMYFVTGDAKSNIDYNPVNFGSYSDKDSNNDSANVGKKETLSSDSSSSSKVGKNSISASEFENENPSWENIEVGDKLEIDDGYGNINREVTDVVKGEDETISKQRSLDIEPEFFAIDEDTITLELDGKYSLRIQPNKFSSSSPMKYRTKTSQSSIGAGVENIEKVEE